MKTLYITTGVLALTAFSFAQSSARAAPPAAEARFSNSHIHLFTKDPEVQRHFWVDVMGATARKMGPDRDGYTRIELTERSEPAPSARN